MPGLFGFIRITAKSFGVQFNAKKTMATMTHSLSHRSDYVLDTVFSESQGFAIGRISHSSAMRHSWPSSQEMESKQSKAFLHGNFTKDYRDTLQQDRMDGQLESTAEILCDLEGFYSLVLISRGFRSVVISVDRKGSEPLFYLEYNGTVFFAPEVKALLEIYEGPVELNPEAIPMFLSCGHLVGDQTLVSSIKRLPGGTYLQIQGNVLEQKPYWSFRPGVGVRHDHEENLQLELVDLLKEAVRKNLGNTDKTAIFLSGGLDSRGILAGSLLASKDNGQQLKTVSWGVAENIPGSDAFIARLIAENFHLDHHFFQRKADRYAEVFEETNFLTDGLSDTAAFHPYEYTIMKQIKDMGFERVLRGDETFGWHGRVYNFHEAAAMVGLRSIRKMTLFSKMLRPKYFREWSDGSDAVMSRLQSDTEGMEAVDAKDYLYYSHRLQGFLHSCASYKQIHFDHRNVLLDDCILEFLLRIPWALRLNKELYRKAVFSLFPPLNTFPFADSSGLENWDNELKRESGLNEHFQKQLEDEESGIWEYFDKEGVLSVFNSVSSSSEGEVMLSTLALGLKKKIRGHVFSLFPRQAEKIRSARAQTGISATNALFRFLVLKNWYDSFIDSRRS